MRRTCGWLVLVTLCFAACGDDEATSDPTGTVVDNTVRPPGNGVRITEDQACTMLRDAYGTRRQELCGVSTTQACPGFVRALYEPDCVEFDEGSVQGCVAHYQSATACEELDEGSCIAATFAGSAPAGCP